MILSDRIELLMHGATGCLSTCPRKRVPVSGRLDSHAQQDCRMGSPMPLLGCYRLLVAHQLQTTRRHVPAHGNAGPEMGRAINSRTGHSVLSFTQTKVSLFKWVGPSILRVSGYVITGCHPVDHPLYFARPPACPWCHRACSRPN